MIEFNYHPALCRNDQRAHRCLYLNLFSICPCLVRLFHALLPRFPLGFLCIITDVWYTEQNNERNDYHMEEMREDLALDTLKSADDAAVNTDSFEVIDYVRELFLNSEEQKKLEKKRLRLTRISVVLLAIVSLVVAVSAVILVPAILTTVQQANEAISIIQKIDVKTITTNIDALAVQATETFDSANEAVKKLNDLDMESLNATIAELKVGVESFSKLDIETMNAAIENLNATVAPLAKFFGKK